jgi:hypothetical protein
LIITMDDDPLGRTDQIEPQVDLDSLHARFLARQPRITELDPDQIESDFQRRHASRARPMVSFVEDAKQLDNWRRPEHRAEKFNTEDLDGDLSRDATRMPRCGSAAAYFHLYKPNWFKRIALTATVLVAGLAGLGALNAAYDAKVERAWQESIKKPHPEYHTSLPADFLRNLHPASSQPEVAVQPKQTMSGPAPAGDRGLPLMAEKKTIRIGQARLAADMIERHSNEEYLREAALRGFTGFTMMLFGNEYRTINGKTYFSASKEGDVRREADIYSLGVFQYFSRVLGKPIGDLHSQQDFLKVLDALRDGADGNPGNPRPESLEQKIDGETVQVPGTLDETVDQSPQYLDAAQGKGIAGAKRGYYATQRYQQIAARNASIADLAKTGAFVRQIVYKNGKLRRVHNRELEIAEANRLNMSLASFQRKVREYTPLDLYKAA